MVGLEGFEPPTHGLGILLLTLILKEINNLTRQIPNKSGKFRNPGATKFLTKTSMNRPEMKVLFVSGYSSDVLREGIQESIPGGFAFLQKPFTYQMLAQKIREMCGSQSVKSAGGKV